MKGQFFVMATVIMIYTLMMLIQYIYDFSDIDLLQLKKMSEVYYIQYIKDSLNKTVLSSYQNLDCVKLDIDVNATENSLKDTMLSRGVSLIVVHKINNCPSSTNVDFNFTLKTPELFTFTQFRTP